MGGGGTALKRLKKLKKKCSCGPWLNPDSKKAMQGQMERLGNEWTIRYYY